MNTIQYTILLLILIGSFLEIIATLNLKKKHDFIVVDGIYIQVSQIVSVRKLDDKIIEKQCKEVDENFNVKKRVTYDAEYNELKDQSERLKKRYRECNWCIYTTSGFVWNVSEAKARKILSKCNLKGIH